MVCFVRLVAVLLYASWWWLDIVMLGPSPRWRICCRIVSLRRGKLQSTEVILSNCPLLHRCQKPDRSYLWAVIAAAAENGNANIPAMWVPPVNEWSYLYQTLEGEVYVKSPDHSHCVTNLKNFPYLSWYRKVLSCCGMLQSMQESDPGNKYISKIVYPLSDWSVCSK